MGTEIKSEHKYPSGLGWPTGDNFIGKKKNTLIVQKDSFNTGGDYIALKQSGNHHYLTMQDAEALCYLLFDLTQPLRDARDKAQE